LWLPSQNGSSLPPTPTGRFTLDVTIPRARGTTAAAGLSRHPRVGYIPRMTTPRFITAGIIAWPVSHSRSPQLHGHWLRQYGIAGAYVPLPVRPGMLHEALRGLAALGFAGCNITVPHKEETFRLVDRRDANAQRVGAVNLVVVAEDGSLEGSNTDGFGFIANLRDRQPHWRAEAGPAVVLGAGGGAHSVITALLDEGVPAIRLLNRSRPRAEHLAERVGGAITVLDWGERHAALDGAALLVNATSLGMVGQPPLEITFDALPRAAVVYDIVYNPLWPPLLLAARARGNPVVDGLGMLLHQARPSFHAWFGVLPDVTPELRAAVEATIP
jgi:shikimate dehydrogenase